MCGRNIQVQCARQFDVRLSVGVNVWERSDIEQQVL